MTSYIRKNKDVSGYQILCILAVIDGDFDPREGKVIVDYVAEHFPFGGNLERADEELSTMGTEDYTILLQQCAEDFYADSNEKERLELINFALKLTVADDNIDESENMLINKLYQYWDISED